MRTFIDMNTYLRKEHFEYFGKMANPYVGLTAEVDITDFLKSVKDRKIKFFSSFLYYVGYALNSVPELRQRIIDGKIAQYDFCYVAYTLALENGTYCNCQADNSLPFAEFLSDVERSQKEAKQNPKIKDDGDVYSLYFISSVPWLSFTHVTQPTPSPADSNPRIIWGKYFERGERIIIPISILCNHAIVDGLHICRFFDTLKTILDEVKF